MKNKGGFVNKALRAIGFGTKKVMGRQRGVRDDKAHKAESKPDSGRPTSTCVCVDSVPKTAENPKKKSDKKPRAVQRTSRGRLSPRKRSRSQFSRRTHRYRGILTIDGFKTANDLRCLQIMGCDLTKAFGLKPVAGRK
jgi:hypothetical protein